MKFLYFFLLMTVVQMMTGCSNTGNSEPAECDSIYEIVSVETVEIVDISDTCWCCDTVIIDPDIVEEE